MKFRTFWSEVHRNRTKIEEVVHSQANSLCNDDEVDDVGDVDAMTMTPEDNH